MAAASECHMCLTVMPIDSIRVLHFAGCVAHLVCKTCALRLKKCPFCGMAITETMALRSVGAPPEDVRVDKISAWRWVCETNRRTLGL